MDEELWRLEDEGWRSLCEGRGARHFGDLMTDDGVMLLANGWALSRDEVVASLDDAPPWESFAMQERRTIPLGAGACALVYRGEAVRGQEPPFVALMSSVYRLENGRWRLAVYQQTPVA